MQSQTIVNVSSFIFTCGSNTIAETIFARDFEFVDRRYSACLTLLCGASSMFNVYINKFIERGRDAERKKER